MADIATLTEQRHKMFEEMYSPSEREIKIHDAAFPDWAMREMRAKRLQCFLVETGSGKVIGGGTV